MADLISGMADLISGMADCASDEINPLASYFDSSVVVWKRCEDESLSFAEELIYDFLTWF